MPDPAALSKLPKVDRVLASAPLANHRASRTLLRHLVQAAIASERARLLAASPPASPPADAESLAATIAARVDALLHPRPRRVINATGVLLHTNLVRAPLAPPVVAAITQAAGPCDLELDLESGARGSRFAALRPLLAALLATDDVHVVGNGAAALLLACTGLGAPDGIVLSRGQMIEIGDGFRVAEMAAAAGVAIHEIGATNRTHLADYTTALRTPPRPSAILWAHRSNFRQEGFVAEVALRDLAAVARDHGVPLIADLGSGSLDAALPGDEPTITAYLEAGVDVVTCSGDKLFGGPQAGILAGRGELIARLRRHPLARALRPGKLTLAALHATIAAHATGEREAIGLQRLLAASPAALELRAAALAEALAGDGTTPRPELRATAAAIGGGSLPGVTIPGVALALPGPASRLARALRRGDPPVVGRVVDDRLLLDLRAVPEEEDAALVAAIRAAYAECAERAG